jgi:hypothetical protein
MEPKVKKGERARRQTSAASNERIDKQILENLKTYRKNNEDIGARLRQLDREWDVERTLELNAAVLALTGTVLGAVVNKRWLVLPAVVASFLVQHAVQGWCPPLPLFRRMGIRTRPEIDREKYALKAIRGDFEDSATANKAWKAVNK